MCVQTTEGPCGVGCHHSFCGECWKGYLENAVSEGPSVLSLRCPHDKCNALVTEELARRFMGPECCEKLSTFQWRSWVDDNPKARLHSRLVHLLTTPTPRFGRKIQTFLPRSSAPRLSTSKRANECGGVKNGMRRPTLPHGEVVHGGGV